MYALFSLLFELGRGSKTNCWLHYPQKKGALLLQVHIRFQAVKLLMNIYLGHQQWRNMFSEC
jgi:hypothetical protein